ncbi:MAG: DNA polymerase III subunit chi [Xanthomonadales bacterium]|nr:DNA polymerase III subunit chi [Xanthomonadales bacterium]
MPDAVEFHRAAGFPDADPLAPALTLLARLATGGGRPLLVLAGNATQARVLDDRLWAVDPGLFLPHALADDEHAAAAWILIAAPGQPAPEADVRLNLGPAPLTAAPGRIIEIVPQDDRGRTAARQRWRDYQAAGLAPVMFELGP